MKDEIDLLPVEKHQRFLKIDTIILFVCDIIIQNSKFTISVKYLKKEVE